MLDEKETAQEYIPSSGTPEVEVVSANDPQFQTVFSDTATYEPPGKRDDFTFGEYVPPVDNPVAPPVPQEAFVPPPLVHASPPVNTSPPAQPVEVAFVPTAANAKMSARMDAMFNKMAELGASDLHLAVSVGPMIRMDGKMKPLNAGMTPLTAESMRELLTSIMPQRIRRNSLSGMIPILHMKSRALHVFAATSSWTVRAWVAYSV